MWRAFRLYDRRNMADLEALQTMLRALQHQTRNQIIREIEAFAGDYHHHLMDGNTVREVVIVEQLLDFLREIPSDK
jgi:hypothetical protein